MTQFRKAAIRANVLESAWDSMSWERTNLQDRLDYCQRMKSGDETGLACPDYDDEIAELEFKFSVYEAIQTALTKLL